jgi:serine protease Do
LASTAGAAAAFPPPETDVKGLLKAVSPSIVKVTAENHKRYIATGIAIAPELVVSNLMVTRYPYNRLYVSTVDGKEYSAEVLGKDSETSLLLLKIGKKALTPMRKAKSAEVGDWTALVGVFYRRFPAIYQGIVSSVSDNQLIVNAPVAPGSSGGAVVNKKGELIGVIRGRFGYTFSPDYIYKDHSTEFSIRSSRSRDKDLCYAVPVPRLMSVAGDLEKYGKVRRGWLGVSLDAANIAGVPVISEVAAGSPAEKAGVRPGDIILGIGGKTARTGSEAARLVRALKPGQKTKIEFLRNKIKNSAVAVIGESTGPVLRHFSISPGRNLVVIPEMSGDLPSIQNYTFTFTGSRSMGVDVMIMTRELAGKFNVKEGTGLMVSRVYKDTAAAKAGLEPADVIVKANGKEVKRLADLRKALGGLQDEGPVNLEIYRKGKLKKISLVPDKSVYSVFGMFDKLKDKMREIRVKVDDENRLTTEEARKKYAREVELIRERELQKYKREVERMKREQEALKKRMERMMKIIEEKEKTKEKKKDKQKTSV